MDACYDVIMCSRAHERQACHPNRWHAKGVSPDVSGGRNGFHGFNARKIIAMLPSSWRARTFLATLSLCPAINQPDIFTTFTDFTDFTGKKNPFHFITASPSSVNPACLSVLPLFASLCKISLCFRPYHLPYHHPIPSPARSCKASRVVTGVAFNRYKTMKAASANTCEAQPTSGKSQTSPVACHPITASPYHLTSSLTATSTTPATSHFIIDSNAFISVPEFYGLELFFVVRILCLNQIYY